LACDAPQHAATGPSRDPSSEKCSGSAVYRASSAAGYLVQRAERQAALRQAVIDGLDAEGQYRPSVPRPAFKASNTLAKRLHSGYVDRRIHAFLQSVS
jgi:hypothetical protein